MGRKQPCKSSNSRRRTSTCTSRFLPLETTLDEYAEQIARRAPRFSESQRARISAILAGHDVDGSGERRQNSWSKGGTW